MKHPLNKKRRNELQRVKYKRRLRIYNLEECNSLRKQSVPCSCYMCSHDKYSRKEKHLPNN